MAQHTITQEQAYEIDRQWSDTGAGLRCVSHRRSGNRAVTMLTVPSNNGAPCYEYRLHDPITGEYAPAFYHVTGPTLAEWYAEQDSRDERETLRDLRNAAVQ